MENKRIIFFSEDKDISTVDVMQWCKIKGYDVCRINSDDKNLSIYISENDVEVTTSYDTFAINKNSTCWFRRAEMPLVFVKYKTKNLFQDNIDVFNFVEHKLTYNALKLWVKQHCKYSSDVLIEKFNKVDVLLKAQAIGINVPDWIVTSQKQHALSFAEKYDFIACKPFSSFHFYKNNEIYKNLTEKLNYTDIQSFSLNFIPRFFQQYIEKKYELRSFYFHGTFYTYAIFSQNNAKTAIDFRNYDNDSPNRCIPFYLSKNYCNKLKLLMQQLNLDTGSFDILVDKNYYYFFLEVSPVGQFGYGSFMCNYNIEEFVANYLINMNL